jgi:uncharacterized protein (TIGR02466 family)
MHTITPVFPTPIFADIIDVLNEDDINVIKDQNWKMNVAGNLTSDNTNILNEHAFLKLKYEIEQRLKLYVTEVYGTSDDVSLRITQSWVNRNPMPTSHHKHNHSNSIVSGVYYVSDNPSPLYLEKISNSPFRLSQSKSTEYNKEHVGIECVKNMLVLFPSDLHHYVKTNLSEEDRYSIAFNTFFSGSIGGVKTLNHLELN